MISVLVQVVLTDLTELDETLRSCASRARVASFDIACQIRQTRVFLTSICPNKGYRRGL